DVDDTALVDVADVALVAGALHGQLFEDAVLQDGDAALLGLEHVDEHFLLHAIPSAERGGIKAKRSGSPRAARSGGAAADGRGTPTRTGWRRLGAAGKLRRATASAVAGTKFGDTAEGAFMPVLPPGVGAFRHTSPGVIVRGRLLR